MEKEILESLKGKSREERAEYFKEHKSEIMDADLESVSGGTAAAVENPNSDVPDGNDNWISSFGYVCRGRRMC